MLVTFMLLASIIAVETRDLLSSVISIGAAGFALSLVFMMLGAPDIAITQVVVEIICLVILIRATVTRDDTTYERHRDMFTIVTSLLILGLFLGACYFCYHEMVPFGRPLMRVSQEYLNQGLAKTGAANAVSAVLLDFRAYDTLAEMTVIFAAIVGAYVVLRKVGRKS